jgi:hypothetical protein
MMRVFNIGNILYYLDGFHNHEDGVLLILETMFGTEVNMVVGHEDFDKLMDGGVL